MLCFFHHPGIVPVPDIDSHEQHGNGREQSKPTGKAACNNRP